VALGDVVGLDVEAHGAARVLDRAVDLGVKVKLDAHIERAPSGAAVLVLLDVAVADRAARLGMHIQFDGKVDNTRRQRRRLGMGLAVDVNIGVSLALGRIAILSSRH